MRPEKEGWAISTFKTLYQDFKQYHVSNSKLDPILSSMVIWFVSCKSMTPCSSREWGLLLLGGDHNGAQSSDHCLCPVRDNPGLTMGLHSQLLRYFLARLYSVSPSPPTAVITIINISPCLSSYLVPVQLADHAPTHNT